jgi:hypothetical protein
MQDIFFVVERAVDEAFQNDRYLLNLYDYLKIESIKGKEAKILNESKTISSVTMLIKELDEYIEGENRIVFEAYKHLGKPRARKIKNYLDKIITDAKRYENDRKPGRKPGSKNRKSKHK